MSPFRNKSGQPPGTMIYSGEIRHAPVKITLIQYNEQSFHEEEISDLLLIKSKLKPNHVHWIDFEGVHDVGVIEKCGELWGIHPLTLEDIVNTTQRPKFEEYDNYLLCVLKHMMLKEEICAEQFSIILSEGLVISFQESSIEAIDLVRSRIRSGKGKVRKYGADYLAYLLLDSVVDEYFSLLEKIGDRIEQIEESLISNPTPQTMHDLHLIRREMIFVRKAVWPLRDLVNNMERSETTLITPATDFYLRDVFDHTIRIIDSVETFRDLLASMMDMYLSTVSNRMNEVMKVLTIISTIFIPITFVVGIYGMNFDYMPELHSPWGYPGVLALMTIMVLGLILFFKKKDWI